MNVKIWDGLKGGAYKHNFIADAQIRKNPCMSIVIYHDPMEGTGMRKQGNLKGEGMVGVICLSSIWVKFVLSGISKENFISHICWEGAGNALLGDICT